MATQASLDFVQQLYVAYYGRPAESEGLQYWADRADEEGQGSIVNAFGESQEFQDSYGDLSNEELVNNLYQQLFSRDADDAGLEYYTGVLTSGEKTLSEIALTISNAAQGSDRVVLNTKVQAADYYTDNAPSYDADSAKSLLAGIDNVNTGADFDAVVGQIDDLQNVSGIAANYQAVQSAEASLELANENFTSALEDLEDSDLYSAYSSQDDDDTDAVELADVSDYLEDQQVALQTSIVTDGTDADLNQDVSDAAAAIRAVEGRFDEDGALVTKDGAAAFSASQLFTTYLNATAAVEADVEADGTTADLASNLNAAIAAYQANNASDTTLDALNTAVDAYLTTPNATNEAAFLDEAATTFSSVFSGEDDASVLADGTAGDNVENLLTTLDERNELVDDAADAQDAIEAAAGTEFAAWQDAQTAVDDREELRDNIDNAQSDLNTLQTAQDAVDTAQTNLDDAQDELGYTVDVLTTNTEAGTAGADLFVFDKENTVDSTITFGDDDAIYLGNGYTLGDAESPNDSALEAFFDADTGVLSVEKFADGSDSNVDLTLTGVTDVSLNADGVLTIA
ncbi:DUF4214 domain-containing protein [Salinicola sp. MIT1003]|uniref:DUF4214 domain-containing protein n=1 Tax=Salinicola sp. MIT1003 TaxID=1882734 RepID=UPI0008DE02B2|nr:DUF4214 domain-containing protein [Salinicola sp. MIT1003]OHZ01526.1 hypothetical protein BC443_16395 [Salinicola sp. MIT1003]